MQVTADACRARPRPGRDALNSLCALQYVRCVANNNTVRIGGQIIDIPYKPRGRSYAKAYVTVRHLLDGGYRVFYGSDLIAESASPPPTESTGEPRSIIKKQLSHERKRKHWRQG